MRGADLKQRVAIRWRLDDQFRTDIAARTRTVFDDHLLIPCFAQFLRKHTAGEISAAAHWFIEP